MKNKFRLLTILFTAILFSVFTISCSDDDEEKKEEEEKALIADYIKENPPAETTENGLHFYPIKVGEGELIKIKDAATVHYKIIDLKSNGILYSTYDFNAEQIYNVGYNQRQPVIDECLTKMKKEGIAKIVVPSRYAYGIYGNTTYNIGEYTPIICEVYIVDIKRHESNEK